MSREPALHVGGAAPTDRRQVREDAIVAGGQAEPRCRLHPVADVGEDRAFVSAHGRNVQRLEGQGGEPLGAAHRSAARSAVPS